MPDDNSKNDAPPNETGVGISGEASLIFAPTRRTVTPRPVYRRKLLKALGSRLSAHLRAWSVERFQLGLLAVFVSGALGVLIADTILCTDGAGLQFWDGCLYEVLGCGVGGGLLGLVLYLLFMRRFFSPTAGRR